MQNCSKENKSRMKRFLSERFGSIAKSKSPVLGNLEVDDKALKTWTSTQKEEKWSNPSGLHKEMMEREERQFEVSESCDVRKFQKLKVNLKVTNTSYGNFERNKIADTGMNKDCKSNLRETYNTAQRSDIQTKSSMHDYRGLDLNSVRSKDNGIMQDRNQPAPQTNYPKCSSTNQRFYGRDERWRNRDAAETRLQNRAEERYGEPYKDQKLPRTSNISRSQTFENCTINENFSNRQYGSTDNDHIFPEKYSRTNARKRYHTDNTYQTPFPRDTDFRKCPRHVEDPLSLQSKDDFSFLSHDHQRFPTHMPPNHSSENDVNTPRNMRFSQDYDRGTKASNYYTNNGSTAANYRYQSCQNESQYEHRTPSIEANYCDRASNMNNLQHMDLHAKEKSYHYSDPEVTRPQTFYRDRFSEVTELHRPGDINAEQLKDPSMHTQEKEVLVTSFLEQCKKLVVNDADQKAIEKVFHILKTEMKQDIEPDLQREILNKKSPKNASPYIDKTKELEAKFSPVACSPDSCVDGISSNLRFEGRTLLKGGVKPRHIPKALIIKPGQQPPSDPRYYDGYCEKTTTDLSIPRWFKHSLIDSEDGQLKSLPRKFLYKADNTEVVDMEIEDDKGSNKRASESKETTGQCTMKDELSPALTSNIESTISEFLRKANSESKKELKDAVFVNSQIDSRSCANFTDKPVDPRLYSSKCEMAVNVKQVSFETGIELKEKKHRSEVTAVTATSHYNHKDPRKRYCLSNNYSAHHGVAVLQDNQIDTSVQAHTYIRMSEKNADRNAHNTLQNKQEIRGNSTMYSNNFNHREFKSPGVKDAENGQISNKKRSNESSYSKQDVTPLYREGWKKHHKYPHEIGNSRSPTLSYRDRSDKAYVRDRESHHQKSFRQSSRSERWT